MSISASDIVYRLGGGVGNTDKNASLSGAMSTAAGGIITGGVANNLFDDVSGPEASAGDIEYRLMYVENAHGSLTLQNAVVWIDSSPLTASPGTDMAIALDSAAVGATAASAAANENSAPTGGAPAPSFTQPASKGAGLAIGDIPAGGKKAIWVRRTTTAGAAAYADSASIRVEGDTAP